MGIELCKCCLDICSNFTTDHFSWNWFSYLAYQYRPDRTHVLMVDEAGRSNTAIRVAPDVEQTRGNVHCRGFIGILQRAWPARGFYIPYRPTAPSQCLVRDVDILLSFFVSFFHFVEVAFNEILIFAREFLSFDLESGQENQKVWSLKVFASQGSLYLTKIISKASKPLIKALIKPWLLCGICSPYDILN